MAFNSEARSRLLKFVLKVRNLIENDFRHQMQGVYGMDPESGSIQPLSALKHLSTGNFEIAQDLRDIAEFYLSKEKNDSAFVLRKILREQTQTFLIRLCAIRMAEERGVFMESLASGFQSAGFVNYRVITGFALGSDFSTYVRYLKSLFDEKAQELPQIFDRTEAFGLLFLEENTFMALLEEMNAPDLISFWREDETIGWIFQYFNTDAEVRSMRGSKNGIPKNSYELAVRNQFGECQVSFPLFLLKISRFAPQDIDQVDSRSAHPNMRQRALPSDTSYVRRHVARRMFSSATLASHY